MSDKRPCLTCGGSGRKPGSRPVHGARPWCHACGGSGFAKPFCKPYQAGLASSTQGVCKRLGRVLTALDCEINSNIVTPESEILPALRMFRSQLVEGLEHEGWSMSYDGGNRCKVRAARRGR